jgi:uncharacterized alpha-E superfamily protein
MLSRVADALFWMSRYYERAEDNARLIDVNINMMLDMGQALADAGAGAPYWNPIIRMTSSFDNFRAHFPKTTKDSALEWLTFHRDNPNSIVNCIWRTRENARAMRDSISTEMWEQINTTYLRLKDTSLHSIKDEGEHAFFRRIREDSQQFQGIVQSTFPHDEAYQWIQLGKFLERADATTRLIDVKYYILLPSLDEVGGPIDQVQWLAVLKSCSAYEAYQRYYVAKITPSRVAEFLVLNSEFPRSVRFCFDHIHWSLRRIASEHGDLGEQPPEVVASNVRHMLSETTMVGIVQFGLHEYMQKLQHRCSEISSKIQQTYFQGALKHVA